jgi:hypothetical protein
MSRKRISPNNPTRNSKQTNRRSPKRASLPVRYRLLALFCGLFLIVGFFFAARQHFASMDFSIKNSKLRRMSEELESDKRRLLLAKEIALSPAEIKKAAHKIGLKVMTAANNIQIARPTESINSEKPRAAEKLETANPKPVAAPNKPQETAAGEKSISKSVAEIKAPDVLVKLEKKIEAAIK